MDRLGSISEELDPSIRFVVLCDKNVAKHRAAHVGFVQHLRALEIGHAVVRQANAALRLLLGNRRCGSATGV